MDRFEPIVTNEFYHVYNRGNNKQRVFHDEADYKAFIKKLEDAVLRRGVTVVAYVLMPNHYHILVRQTCDNICGKGHTATRSSQHRRALRNWHAIFT
jgi:REP element-mobilizing transposase RayT